MKLRSYIIGFTAVLMGLVVSLLVILSQKNMHAGFEKLVGQQRDNVTGLLRSALDQEAKRLISYGRILRADNDLASSFILSVETHDKHLIEEKLVRLKEDVKFDLINVISMPGVSVFDPLNLGEGLIARVRANGSGERLEVVTLNNRLALVSLTSLGLYGKQVGVLILGTYIDINVADRIAELTDARVTLSTVEEPKGHLVANQRPAVFKAGRNQTVYATIEPSAPTSNNLFFRLSRQGIIFGILSIGLLSVAFCTALEFAFIRKFREVVRQLNSYTASLEQGSLAKLTLGRYRISEVDVLSTSLEQLSLRLINYSSRLVNQSSVDAKLQQQAALTSMARQVAHDIRSPLTALNFAVQSAHALPENVRLLVQRSASRIQDIANCLLQSGAPAESIDDCLGDPILLTHLVEMIVSEKRMALQENLNVQICTSIPEESYGLFVGVEPREMGRIISNLIDNSIKAVGLTGHIKVSVALDQGQAVLTIEDDGIGIPDSLIELLWFQGASYWSDEIGLGNGLGLHHAKIKLEEWNGSAKIESELDKGTKVIVRLPQIQAPDWFARRIVYPTNATTVILDDDPSIHRTWSDRFATCTPLDSSSKMEHLSTPDQLRSWLVENDQARTLFLIDYEFLGQKINGLDLISELRIEDRAVLVTSRFEEHHVRTRSAAMSVKLIPKSLALHVPIVSECDITKS